jgi:hypothetical protein
MSENYQDTAMAGASMLAMFAEINDLMIGMRVALEARPEVTKAVRGCDVPKYRDDFKGPGLKKYAFEAYVEAETRAGDTFCWWLDIEEIATGWEIHRDISKNEKGKDGAESVSNFEDLTFEGFDELKANIFSLLAEFIGSAKALDFDSPA